MQDPRNELIKQHFQKESLHYDETIVRLIPHYSDMVEALVSSLPFEATQQFSVIDLGCGTGSIAYTIRRIFPEASLTCLDFSEKMLALAEKKLGNPKPLIIQADLNTFDFTASYDAIVSSLALHHIATDDEKLAFYKKIYAALKPGGMFINLDEVKGADVQINDLFSYRWKKFMLENAPSDEVAKIWEHSIQNNDRPTSMMNHLTMLQQCGFSSIDIIFKYYSFAVFSGKKQ